MAKSLKKFIFFIIGSLLSSIYAVQNFPLNIIILLDEGSEFIKEKKEGFGVTLVFDLQAAIDQNIPFLTNSSILANLQMQGAFDKTLDKLTTDKWIVYKNSSEEFIIGLPANYVSSLDLKNRSNLYSIGLSGGALQRIASNDIKKYLADKEKNFDSMIEKNPKISMLEPLNLENLKKIFTNADAHKRIFLIGHGLFSGKLLEERLKEKSALVKAVIAGLPVFEFQQFLEFLNTVGTDLIYISSCYSGGYNLLQGFQTQSDEIAIKPLALSYFVVVGALTDEMTRGGTVKFDEFFKNLNKFFTVPGSLKNPFNEILKPISYKLIQNLPSIRYPGSLNYFKVIDVDKKTEIITYAISTALSIEKKSKIVINKEAVLIYPIEVKIPLKIEGDDIPRLISMIPGHAFHILKGIEIAEPLDEGIKKMFFFFSLPSEKIFLLEAFNASNYAESGLPKNLLTNVMIHKLPLRAGGGIIGKIDDQFYKAAIKYDPSSNAIQPIKFTMLDKKAAQNLIQNAISKFKVEPAAVKQASGGQEDLEALRKKAIKKFAQ